MAQTAGCPKTTWSYTIIRFVVKESTWSTRRFTFSILPKEATKFFSALAVFNNCIILCSDWRHSFNVNHLSSNLVLRSDRLFLEFFEWFQDSGGCWSCFDYVFSCCQQMRKSNRSIWPGWGFSRFFPQEVVQLTTNNAWKIYGKYRIFWISHTRNFKAFFQKSSSSLQQELMVRS